MKNIKYHLWFRPLLHKNENCKNIIYGLYHYYTYILISFYQVMNKL